MNTTDDVAWIESRIERDILVLTFLVSRLESKRHPQEEYHRVLDEALARGHDRIILNLSNLRYTNHTWGIFQLLFTANTKVKEMGGRLVICGMKGHVRRVFQFANLDRIFPAFRSETKALDALTHQPDRCRNHG